MMLSNTNFRARKCAVFNCDDLVSPSYRFPINDESTFNVWVKVINHPRFSTLTPREIYKSYYVCHKHFAEDVLVSGTKRGLKLGAVPTLHLRNLSEGKFLLLYIGIYIISL